MLSPQRPDSALLRETHRDGGGGWEGEQRAGAKSGESGILTVRSVCSSTSARRHSSYTSDVIPVPMSILISVEVSETGRQSVRQGGSQ